MKYIITKTDALKPYFGMGEGDPNMHCRDLYTLFDISCIEIAEPLFDTIYPLIPVGYEEVTYEEAHYGSNFFSEVRETVKVLDINSLMAETIASEATPKIEIEFTQEMRTHTRNFMYRFAKEIIETEYNYRFKNLRNTTELEQASWEIQKHEAREWLTYGDAEGHITPFLDYLVAERGEDKTEFANKVLTKAEEYQDRLSTALVQYQLLIKKFKNAETIWDMNLLYEEYFGIMVPAFQAADLGLQDESGSRVFTAEDGTLKLDINNPRFGNKLNF